MEGSNSYFRYDGLFDDVAGQEDTTANEIDFYFDPSMTSNPLVETLSAYAPVNSDYLHHYLWILAQFLQGPWAILSNHSSIVITVFKARLATLVIDLIRPGSQLIKDITIISFGMYQLIEYLKQTTSKETTNSMMILLLLYCIVLTLLTPQNRSERKYKRPSKGHDHQIHLWTIVATLLPILYNEHLIHFGQIQDHTYLRSILMVLSMKVISISRQRPIFSDLSYLIHPASTILGLWHPNNIINDHPPAQRRLDYLREFFLQLSRVSRSFVKVALVLVILVHSSDFLSYLSSIRESELITRVISVYSTAQEFRFSHYFSMLLANTLLLFWLDPKEKLHEVCHIGQVEFPRSLVQVVISWNVPMHVWLKNYIFKPTSYASQSVAVGVGVTYLLSSILHGFKFHIWSVLLTLGLLTWVEHAIRLSLSRRLNACVLPRKCVYLNDGQCSKNHERTSSNSIMVKIINTCFTFLAMMHLGYLGYIFQGNTDQANYKKAIGHWSELYFYSHMIGLFSYFVATMVR